MPVNATNSQAPFYSSQDAVKAEILVVVVAFMLSVALCAQACMNRCNKDAAKVESSAQPLLNA